MDLSQPAVHRLNQGDYALLTKPANIILFKQANEPGCKLTGAQSFHFKKLNLEFLQICAASPLIYIYKFLTKK